MKSLCITAVVCFAGAVAIGACSSSSTPTGMNNTDAGRDAPVATDTGSAADTMAAGDGATCPAVGTGANQYSTGNAACDSCLGSMCCSAFTACVDNPSCLTALKCTTMCVKDDGGTTDACGLMCIEASDGGAGGAVTLSTCQASSCSTQC
jgi:hypothetical protein